MTASNTPAWEGLRAVFGSLFLDSPLRRLQLASYVRKVVGALDGSGTVLDVGAGNGAVAVEVARRVPSARIIAVDISGAMLERLRARARRTGVEDRIETRVAGAASTGLESDSVDVVTCTFLLHELSDPAAAVGEMLRVLRPSGKLFIRDFAPGRLFGLTNLFCRFHNEDAHGPLEEGEIRAALGRVRQLRIERRGRQVTVSCTK
jgi:ubiquinone/menaquinone biosynthesis C-methylase UbiE